MRIQLARVLLCSSVLLTSACRASGGTGSRAAEVRAAEAEIARVLDAWHASAGRADGAGYFGAMAEDSVYLGTDATERWSLSAFRAFCEPYFAKGVGWKYEPRERHVSVEGDHAWFDEKLWNEKYGECRGTGVLRQRDGAWKIVHYSLTFPVPNEKAAKVIELIRG